MQKFFLNDIVRVKHQQGLWRICEMSVPEPNGTIQVHVCPNECKFSISTIGVPEDHITLADAHLYPNGMHKHADLLLAYARGADIEYSHPANDFWISTTNPVFRKDFLYRIVDHPKPNPELVRAKRTLEDLRAAVALAEKQVKELENKA